MSEALTWDDKVSRLTAAAVGSGGATLDPVSGQAPRAGYVVALAPEGPGQTVRVPMADLQPGELDASAAWALLTARNLGVCAGVWYDDAAREWVFDLVEVVPTLGDALTLGAERHQSAVYGIEEGQTYYLNAAEAA